MPKKFTDEEYYRLLPKKQVGTAVLLFNEEGKLLIVKPDYKDSWLVPGGSCDAGESPLECARRETKEEIGINITEIRLLGIYHTPSNGLYPDSLKFLFYGGILDKGQVSSIDLQTSELQEYSFVSPAQAIPMLSSSLRRSVPLCLEALEKGTFAYLDA